MADEKLSQLPVATTPLTGTELMYVVKAGDSYQTTLADVLAGAGGGAPLNSPAFTGVPTAPTAAVGTNTTQLATTAGIVAERAATATLTNKTLTAPAISSPTGLVKADVGLGSVDNTADTAKPVSTAQQTALNAKAAGAASSVAGHVAVFSDTTGKVLSDTGAVALNGVVTSAGAGDSGKVPMLDATGLLDVSFSTVAPINKGGSAATTANNARANLNKGRVTLTDAATIATDCSLGNVFQMTLITTGRTMGAPTNQSDGATYIWRIKQDGTGGRTLTWASAFRFPGGTDPVVTTTANATDIITGVSDGTNIDCTFGQAFA